jgi:hypothetical protein
VLVLCSLATAAAGADRYDTTTHQLSSPTVKICNATYSNMVVTIGSLVSGPSGSTATGSGDSLSPAFNQITVPAVSVGTKDYFNVVASVTGLVSVGGVSGADTYDGKTLTIAAVQVGETVYAGTVVQVGSILNVGGGLPKGIRDLYNVENGHLFIPAVQDQQNGRVYTNVTVTVAHILSIGSGGSPPACGAAGNSSMLTAAQVNAAAASVQSYYQTLPHGSASADLSTLAAYMVQSGLFVSAAVTPGGISATLPDGMDFIEFADRIKDFCTNPVVASPSPAGLVCLPTGGGSSVASAGGSSNADAGVAVGPANPHDVVFLVNLRDKSGAFTPPNQALMAAAWTSAGFTAPKFGVENLEVTLDNILALGSGHPIDFLDVVTHGVVYTPSSGATKVQYNWLSDTEITDANNLKYALDLLGHRIHYAGYLYNPDTTTVSAGNTANLGLYTFAPEFLTAHLTFNAGAIVDNESCYGQNPAIAQAVQKTLQNAGVGTYMGWDNTVDGADADETDAFLFDRLLGEEHTTGLTTLVKPRPQLQRPFPFSDVLSAMAHEVRDPVTQDALAGNTYVQGIPSGDNPNPVVNFLLSSLADNSTSDLVEYSMPSISNLVVVEAAGGGTLRVNGNFPAIPGKGQLVDASGTYALSPTAWSKTQIQFSLPPGGNGAAGLVTIFTADGIPSNAVPLTEWKGQLFVAVNNVLSNMNGIAGSGSGTIATTTNLDFRADVHPVVTTIDTPPVPQNFVFLGVMGDATTSLTSANVQFKSGSGSKSAQFGLVEPVTTQTPIYTSALSPGNFVVSPYTGAGAPANCNSGVPGPQVSGPTNVFCPFGGIYVANALSCSDTDGTLCSSSTLDYIGYYGYPPSVAAGSYVTGFDGQLVFTMNPTTYAITFTSTPATLHEDYLFATTTNGTGDSITINLSATIKPPLNAPGATTPAAVIPE